MFFPDTGLARGGQKFSQPHSFCHFFQWFNEFELKQDAATASNDAADLELQPNYGEFEYQYDTNLPFAFSFPLDTRTSEVLAVARFKQAVTADDNLVFTAASATPSGETFVFLLSCIVKKSNAFFTIECLCFFIISFF